MNDQQFHDLALELADRFRGTELCWFLAVVPRGRTDPQSASNLELHEQIALLRALADSLETDAIETHRIERPRR